MNKPRSPTKKDEKNFRKDSMGYSPGPKRRRKEWHLGKAKRSKSGAEVFRPCLDSFESSEIISSEDFGIEDDESSDSESEESISTFDPKPCLKERGTYNTGKKNRVKFARKATVFVVDSFKKYNTNVGIKSCRRFYRSQEKKERRRKKKKKRKRKRKYKEVGEDEIQGRMSRDLSGNIYSPRVWMT